MSYALKSDSEDIAELTRAANHFVIFDVKNVIACHDFEFIDVIPDFLHMSCHGHYNHSAVRPPLLSDSTALTLYVCL